MELRQLKYFVAVAEERSFRRAAQRLHVSQPPLSVQIRKLEEELRVELFVRDAHGALLTPAGEEMLRHASIALRQIERGAADTIRVAKGQSGALAIGFTDDYVEDDLARLIADFQHSSASLLVETAPGLTYQLAQRVFLRELDVAFVCPPLPADLEHMGMLRLPSTRIRLIFPAHDPCASRSEVSLAELRDRAFIAHSHHYMTGFYIQLLKLFDEAGFLPHVRHRCPSAQMTMNLVASGVGIALATEHSLPTPNSEVALVPILSAHAEVQRAVIWRDDSRSATLAAFLALLRKTVRRFEAPAPRL